MSWANDSLDAAATEFLRPLMPSVILTQEHEKRREGIEDKVLLASYRSPLFWIKKRFFYKDLSQAKEKVKYILCGLLLARFLKHD